MKIKGVNKHISVTRLDASIKTCSESQIDSKADDLVALIQERAELFHNSDNDSFATLIYSNCCYARVRKQPSREIHQLTAAAFFLIIFAGKHENGRRGILIRRTKQDQQPA